MRNTTGSGAESKIFSTLFNFFYDMVGVGKFKGGFIIFVGSGFKCLYFGVVIFSFGVQNSEN